MMMAGLDGIENKIDPGQPLDKDIYDLGPEELAKVPSMPGSLDEALDALEHLGTPEAKAHLEALARGTPGCLRTVQAKESLARMAAR